MFAWITSHRYTTIPSSCFRPFSCSNFNTWTTGSIRIRSGVDTTCKYVRTLNSSNDENQISSTGSGDSLRKSTGIRPSLHPMTINALSEALLLRAKKQDVWSEGDPEPLQLALLAGKLATSALIKREEMLRDRENFSSTSGSSLNDTEDNMWELPTMREKQAVSGRVIGVIVRLQELEHSLVEKVSAAAWVSKYGEHASFGLLACEISSKRDELSNKDKMEVTDRLKVDPLFRMSRSECLLALFIENIEKPQLEKLQDEVADGSKIDFLDMDRLDVLLS